jgi:hypothetical protein
MTKKIFAIALVSLVLFSCHSYKDSPVSEAYVSTLNEKISVQQKNGATWTKSPEDIVRQFFPPLSKGGGSTRYEINKAESSAGCKVSVMEEGPINDEVLGERRTFHFENREGVWTITDMKYEIKRR